MYDERLLYVCFSLLTGDSPLCCLFLFDRVRVWTDCVSLFAFPLSPFEVVFDGVERFELFPFPPLPPPPAPPLFPLPPRWLCPLEEEDEEEEEEEEAEEDEEEEEDDCVFIPCFC